jgi:hypothetical protein
MKGNLLIMERLNMLISINVYYGLGSVSTLTNVFYFFQKMNLKKNEYIYFP